MRTILISAYGCEPLKGSEQGVGWNWVLQMARNNRLHVITRANNRETIEAHLPDDIAQNITFHYYDTNSFIRSFKNKAKGLYFYYFCWQVGIIPLIRRLIKEHHFDYSMHLTFGSMWMPTFLPFFKVPFIWGPVGGGDGEPWSFLKVLPFKKKLLQYIRILINKSSLIIPMVTIPVCRSVAILARTNNTANVIPTIFRSKVRVILETAMEDNIFDYPRFLQNVASKETKLIVTGRLMPSKNAISAIKASALIPDSHKFTLTIIGSGPEKGNIEREIEKLNLVGKVKMIPEMPRAGILNELAKSDIYLFPSLREGGSWALMEAMALGLPVICLKWSGMEIITDDESAIRLPVTNPYQMPKDIAQAVCHLIDNPDLMGKMGEAGRARIKNEFNWEKKREFMESLLNDLDKKCWKQK